MRHINEIIVHCSATPRGRDVDAATIRTWHKKRGWSDIGYHYVIKLDGAIEDGRPVALAGAHCRGRNENTIGVCYVGGVSAGNVNDAKDTRTFAQKEALTYLLEKLVSDFPAIKKISGHRDYAAKACPSFNATLEYAYIVKRNRRMVQSRTVQGASMAGVGGVGLVADSAIDLQNALQQADGAINAGTILGLILGAVIIGGAFFAAYAKWDDAGRPMPMFMARWLKKGEFASG